RQVEALAMPLIDLLRPGVTHRASHIGRPNRIIADFGMAIGMAVDPATEMMRQHLRAETNAEKRLLLLERHAQPINLTTDEIGGVIRAHRAAENDGTSMGGHSLGERIGEARAAHVERVAALAQGVPDAPRGGGFLVQHNQDRAEHSAVIASIRSRVSIPARVGFSRWVARPRHAATHCQAGARYRRPRCWRAMSSSTRVRGAKRIIVVTARLMAPGTTTRRPCIRPR